MVITEQYSSAKKSQSGVRMYFMLVLHMNSKPGPYQS